VGVVLAAGRSQRLEPLTRGGSKALLRLGGLSLAERAVRTLLGCGLERVLVVGHDAGPVAAVVCRLARDRVRAVYADCWRDGNGASLAAVEPALAGEALFVLLTTDHLFGEGALERLLAASEPAVLVDPAPNRPGLAGGLQGAGRGRAGGRLWQAPG
jgi:choline kinase